MKVLLAVAVVVVSVAGMAMAYSDVCSNPGVQLSYAGGKPGEIPQGANGWNGNGNWINDSGLNPGGWGGGNANCNLITFTKTDVQAAITAVLGSNPDWGAAMLVVPKTGTQVYTGYHPVVGLFQQAGLNWTKTDMTGSQVTAGVSWGGVTGQKFEAMATAQNNFAVVPNYTQQAYTFTGVTTVPQTIRIPLSKQMINDFLNGNWTGFFVSTADGGSSFRTNGPTQWGGGMGYMDLEIVGTPEPASLCLLALGGLAMLRRRR